MYIHICTWGPCNYVFARQENSGYREIEEVKSIRAYLHPGNSCGLVAYTLRILAQCFMGHTAIF